MGLPVTSANSFRVYIGNGDYLNCDSKCAEVKLCLQGHRFNIDLFILPIQGADVVLGIQWLELLGSVITNYKMLTMDFQWNGKEVHLMGEPQVSDELLMGKQLMKLSKAQNIASLFHLKSVENEDSNTHVPAYVQPLLQQFSYIF